jgi:predicted XRE-type DNA-binding protein
VSRGEGGRIETVRSIFERFNGDVSRLIVVPELSWHSDPVGEIAAAIRGIRPTLAVVDTLAALAMKIGAQRGDAVTWQPIFDRIGEATEVAGAATLHIHHKPGAGNTPRDSTAISAGVDHLVDFRREPDESRWEMHFQGRVGTVPTVHGDVTLSPVRRIPTHYYTEDAAPEPKLLDKSHDLDLRFAYLIAQRPMSQNKAREFLDVQKQRLSDAVAGLKVGMIEERKLAWHLTDDGAAWLRRELEAHGIEVPRPANEVVPEGAF